MSKIVTVTDTTENQDGSMTVTMTIAEAPDPGPPDPGPPDAPIEDTDTPYPPPAFEATGSEVLAGNDAELRDAYARAGPGDTIKLRQDATFGAFTFDRPKVRIVAEKRGTATFTGPVTITAEGVLLQGHTANKTVTVKNCTGAMLARMTFKSDADFVKLEASAKQVRIDRSEFNWANSKKQGVEIVPSDKCNHLITNCLFTNSRDGDGGESVRTGSNTGHTHIKAGIVIDRCVFDHAMADAEQISFKSSANKLQRSTFLNGGNTGQRGPCFRHGDSNAMYRCYVDQAGTVRVYGGEHLLQGNTLTGNARIDLRCGTQSTAEWPDGGSDPPAQYPTCTNARVIDGKGPVVVGAEGSGSMTVKGSVISNNEGNVSLKNQSSTTQDQATQNTPPAVKLSAADVGVDLGG